MSSHDFRVPVVELDPEQKRRQRLRNIAIGLALAGLVAIFYVRSMIVIHDNLAAHVAMDAANGIDPAKGN